MEKRARKVFEHIEGQKQIIQHQLESAVKTQIPGRLVGLLDASNQVRQTGTVNKSFFREMHQLVHEGTISKVAADEIISNMFAKLPDLPQKTKNVLDELRVKIMSKARGVHAWHGEFKCETALDLYSFDAYDKGPHFPVHVLYLDLTKQLRKLNHNWDDPKGFPTLKNLFYRQTNGTPETLNYLAATRVRIWYQCFKRYCNFWTDSKPSMQKKLSRYDVLFYPTEVIAWDSSFFSNLWGGVKSVVTSVSAVINWSFRNQIILIILRNLICIGFVWLMIQPLGFDAVTLTFLCKLLFGFLLETILKAVVPIFQKAKDAGFKFEILGSLGILIETFVAGILSVVPPSVGDVFVENSAWGLIAWALTYFSGGWFVALSAFFGVEAARKIFNVDTLVDRWKKAGHETWNTISTPFSRDGATFSGLGALLAIHMIPYFCTLLGFVSEKGGKACRNIVSWIQYIVGTSSFVWMLWDMLAEIHLMFKLRTQTLSSDDLKTLSTQSSCIKAIYETRKPTNHLHKDIPNFETQRLQSVVDVESSSVATKKVAQAELPKPSISLTELRDLWNYDSEKKVKDFLQAWGSTESCSRTIDQLIDVYNAGHPNDGVVSKTLGYILRLWAPMAANEVMDIKNRACLATANGARLAELLNQ